MRLVLFNIGWMERCQGQTPDDSIHGGGGYVDDHGHGFEVENFLRIGAGTTDTGNHRHAAESST